MGEKGRQPLMRLIYLLVVFVNSEVRLGDKKYIYLHSAL